MRNKDLADEFADSPQGIVRGNPLRRMNARKHPALIRKLSAHLQSSHRIRGEMNHRSFALARFFGKLLVRLSLSSENFTIASWYRFEIVSGSAFPAVQRSV
jgi:hypothetical protein